MTTPVAIRHVNYAGYRIVMDEELLSAPTLDGLVTLLNNSSYRREPAATNAAYMKELASRSRVSFGREIRSDTASNFLDDMEEVGAIQFIKRELAID